MTSRRESTADIAHDEVIRRFSLVPKLINVTSKFTHHEEERQTTLQTPTRRQPPSRLDRRRSTVDNSIRFVLFYSYTK
jgi:hypothetical protein